MSLTMAGSITTLLEADETGELLQMCMRPDTHETCAHPHTNTTHMHTQAQANASTGGGGTEGEREVGRGIKRCEVEEDKNGYAQNIEMSDMHRI